MTLLLCLMNIFKDTRMTEEFIRVTIYVKHLQLNKQDILLFEGGNIRRLLILMKKVILGSLSAACLNQILVILKWLVFQVESFSIILTASI